VSESPAIRELREQLRITTCALPRGGASKWTSVPENAAVTAISTTGLGRILEYHHDEYTVTAGSGTPLGELVGALAEHRQYLPFDPPFVDEGATLGGTVAAGLSGSGAQRHGRLRDFILACQFLTGDGRLLRSGAKVVKNAAGFDLPKLFTGSLGRLGILTEITLKVFPAPASTRRLRVDCRSLEDAVEQLVRLNGSPLVLDELDLHPPASLMIRLGGPRSAMEARIERLRTFLDRPVEVITDRSATHGMPGATDAPTIKVALCPTMIARFHQAIAPTATDCRFLFGGATAWFEWPGPINDLDRILQERALTGLVLRGETPPALIGCFHGAPFFDRFKRALDPDNRFPPIVARAHADTPSHTD
jgi:glycolate oxidase FAD binding subunit